MPTPEPIPVIDVPAEETPLVPVAPGALAVMERAGFDAMFMMAMQKPRPEITKIRQRMLTYATVDEETAESCIYTLKRWDAEARQHKLIQGPSIRLAEILTVCWTNLRAGARTIDNDGKKITSQGVCFDMENNVQMFAEVSRRITHKDGRPYSEDMQLVTAAACNSIAKRNAVFQVVPFALIKPVYEEIKKVVTGNVSTLITKRDKLFKRFYAMGVTQDRILAILQKENMDSVDLEDLALLVGVGTAIKDRELTIEEAFTIPVEEDEEKARPIRMKIKDKLAQRRAERMAQQEPPKEEQK